MTSGYWDMAPSTLAQWVGGLGTIAAVIVALFKDPIRAWWNRPKLTAVCTKEIPETVKAPITAWQGKWPGGGGGRWDGGCYFVRIKVGNKGRTRAEKVQVSALKLTRRRADGRSFAYIQTTLPFNMKWSNYPATAPVTTLDGISQEMWAFCDIVSLCDPSNPYQRRPAGVPLHPAPITVGQLQIEFDLADEWQLLAPGTYQLTLRIGAANAAPICKVVEFTHDGRWTQDDVAMRRDYLDVSLS